MTPDPIAYRARGIAAEAAYEGATTMTCPALEAVMISGVYRCARCGDPIDQLGATLSGLSGRGCVTTAAHECTPLESRRAAQRHFRDEAAWLSRFAEGIDTTSNP